MSRKRYPPEQISIVRPLDPHAGTSEGRRRNRVRPGYRGAIGDPARTRLSPEEGSRCVIKICGRSRDSANTRSHSGLSGGGTLASAELLLPLTTALERELGLEPRVAKEIEEVAEDIRRDMEEYRRRQPPRTQRTDDALTIVGG